MADDDISWLRHLEAAQVSIQRLHGEVKNLYDIALQARRLEDMVDELGDDLSTLSQQVQQRVREGREDVDYVREQNDFLQDALREAERWGVPADATVVAWVDGSEVLAMYRQLSGRTRGPLPRYIQEALEAGAPDIAAAMTQLARVKVEALLSDAVQSRVAGATVADR